MSEEILSIETKEDFVKPAARRFTDVPLPGHRKCRIRSMLAGEMRTFRTSMSNSKGELIRNRSDRLQELLVAQCMCNTAGERILTDADAMSPDFDLLDGGEIAALFAKCKEFTGFASDPDWLAIENAAKNSESTSTS